MLYDQLSPYVRSAISSYLPAPFTINWRSLLDYELIYIQEGSFLLRTEEKDYVCQEDDVILLCPGMLHRIECIGSITVLQPHVHFDMVYDAWSPQVYVSYKPLSEFTEQDRKMMRPNLLADTPVGPLLHLPNPRRVMKKMQAVIDLQSKRPPMLAMKLKAAMLELLAEVFEHVASHDPRETAHSGSTLREVKDYIDNNAGSVITLDSLAMHFHYSKYHLERKFRERYGTTVIRYYHARRVELAREMLIRQPSVTAAAEKLSFGSVYLFSRFFHHHTGMSPTEFVQSVRNATAPGRHGASESTDA